MAIRNGGGMKRLALMALAALGFGVTSGAFAQSVKFEVGQTWTGTFQGFGTWTAKFTELDGDGDPRGLTTSGPDQRTAGGFDNDGGPVFYITKSGDSLFCVGDPQPGPGGVYSGTILRKQGSANAVNTKAPCSFSQAGASPSPATTSAWPPSSALSAGITVRLELRQLWTAGISGKDEDGDWTGKATGADGKSATLYSFSQSDGTFAFQIAYASSELCVVSRTAAQGVSGVYTGKRSFKLNKDSKYVLEGDCRVTIGNGAPAPQPNPQPQPAPQPAPPSGVTLNWPPSFNLGQSWRVEITGPSAVTLNVNLSENDRFGSPSGKVGSQGVSLYYSRSSEFAVIEISDGQATVGCKFKGAASVSGSSLTNGSVVTRPNPQSPFQNVSGVCRATLTNGSAPQTGVTPVGPAPVGPAPVGPAPVLPAPAPLQTSNPPNTSAWPLRLEVGTSWSAEIQTLGSWNVTFRVLDRDGDPSGEAVPTGAGAKLTAAFYYAKNDDDVRLELYDDAQIDYICIFERNEISGLKFSGWRYESTADKKLKKTTQRCTMQFLGRVTLTSFLEPLARFNPTPPSVLK
jgi:hypothetical protein